jgi:phage shock protein PspC (stress-responsive transcriptional regulator)
MRGPPITVRCECGEVRHVPYGERWTCERCGRSWNTAQIPAEEYGAILREMRNLRLSVIGVAAGLAAVFGLLALFVSESLFLLLPVVLAAWFILYMPAWRRRVRQRARSLPNWDLHPD